MLPSPVDAPVMVSASKGVTPSSMPWVNWIDPMPVFSWFTVVAPVGTFNTTMSPSVASMSIVSVLSVNCFRFPMPPPPPISSTDAAVMSMVVSTASALSFSESRAPNVALPVPAFTESIARSLMSVTLMLPPPHCVVALIEAVTSTSSEPACAVAAAAALLSPSPMNPLSP